MGKSSTQRTRIKDKINSINTHLDYCLRYLRDIIETYRYYGYERIAQGLEGLAAQLIVIQQLLKEFREKV